MIHRAGVGPRCWTVSADDCTTFLSQAVLTVPLLILWFPSWFWVYLIGRYWHHKGLLKPSPWHCEVPEGMDCSACWFYNKSPLIIRQPSDSEAVFQGNTWATRVAVQSLSRVRLFAIPWTAALQASVSFTLSQSLLKLTSTESVEPSNHSILCCPLLLHSVFFPAKGSFPVSQLFASGGLSIWAPASASVLPMNIQGWFPLGLTGLISLLSKGLSRIFPSTTIWKHQFFGAQPSLWSNSHLHTATWVFYSNSAGIFEHSLCARH